MFFMTSSVDPSSFSPSRRSVLRAGAATAAVVGASTLVNGAIAKAEAEDVAPAAPEGHQVFQHGVASGDPMDTSVLLWTRATSHPGDIPGSEQGSEVKLRWEVAADEAFANIAASGEAAAVPGNDNTVKVDATGLQPDTWYNFRFTVTEGEYQGQTSPVGRTRTNPSTGVTPESLGIALTSCANWEAGYFSAYRDMSVNPEVDIIMCVGDYLYEYERGGYTGKTGAIRDHEPPHEIISLADYRRRYGHYRTDPDLQAAHQMKPWMVTWDDHEVANDSYNTGAENHDPETSGAIAELMGLPEEGIPYNLDQWDGFAAERRRLIQMMGDEGLDNIVFLTGDIHSSWACDIPVTAGRYPADGIAAVEIVGTSVNASNIDDIVKLPQRNGISQTAEQALMAANRHIKWIQFDHHGYCTVKVRPNEILAEWRFVEDKTIPNQPLYTAMNYRVVRGQGISPA